MATLDAAVSVKSSNASDQQKHRSCELFTYTLQAIIVDIQRIITENYMRLYLEEDATDSLSQPRNAMHALTSATCFKERSIRMTISLKEVKNAHELRAGDVSPVVANVKYAQLNDQDVSPVVANVKYAQLNDQDVSPVVANVKYAQLNDQDERQAA